MTSYQALEAQVDAILWELYAIDYQADAEEMMSGLYQETITAPGTMRTGTVVSMRSSLRLNPGRWKQY